MRKLFDKIKLSQVQTLCDTIAKSEIRELSYVKSKYSEHELWFDETLLFLQELNIVCKKSSELVPLKRFPNKSNLLVDFKKQFLAILFSANGDVSEQLRSFLVKFIYLNDTISFNPTPSDKIKFSSIRNLLLELNFISLSHDKNGYFVNSEYSELFIQQFSKRIVSPKTFKKQQEEKEKIGLNAEKLVIDFEIRRLSEISIKPNEIEHIALKNVSTGYDIKSFENYLNIDSKKIERYIEVKAVSLEDYKFFWSRNEIEVAKFLREKYFLYLLPVTSKNTFDVEKLMIISDPFSNVYPNQLKWHKQEESISFSKITSE